MRKERLRAAAPSAAGPPNRFTRLSSPASTSPRHLYSLNRLRYDLRKLKGHTPLQRDGSRYSYRLTSKGLQVALLFLFFHKRLCGPLAHSRFQHQPPAAHRPDRKFELACHNADRAIQDIGGSARCLIKC